MPESDPDRAETWLPHLLPESRDRWPQISSLLSKAPKFLCPTWALYSTHKLVDHRPSTNPSRQSLGLICAMGKGSWPELVGARYLSWFAKSGIQDLSQPKHGNLEKEDSDVGLWFSFQDQDSLPQGETLSAGTRSEWWSRERKSKTVRVSQHTSWKPSRTYCEFLLGNVTMETSFHVLHIPPVQFITPWIQEAEWNHNLYPLKAWIPVVGSKRDT